MAPVPTKKRAEGELIVVATVRGNCGQTHQSVEEWQQCMACAHAVPHYRPWWRNNNARSS